MFYILLKAILIFIVCVLFATFVLYKFLTSNKIEYWLGYTKYLVMIGIVTLDLIMFVILIIFL